MLTEDELIRSAEMNKKMYIYIPQFLHFWNPPKKQPVPCTSLGYTLSVPSVSLIEFYSHLMDKACNICIV